MNKGTQVETPAGIGTIAGVYTDAGRTIVIVKLPSGTHAFAADKVTPAAGTAQSCRPAHCEAYLEGKYRHCRNKATVRTAMGWVCCKHAGAAE